MIFSRRFADESHALAKLAWPIVAAQLGLMLIGVTDIVMSGQLGGTALAAISLGNAYHWSLLVFGQGILMALDPIVSQAFGAKEDHAISLAFQRGIVVAVAMFIPFAIAFQFAAPVLTLLGQPPEVVPLAAAFVRITAPSILAHFLFLVLRQTLQNMNITQPALRAVVVGIIANIIGDYAFLFGAFGLPRMGPVGTGLSTTLSRYVMLFALLFFARKPLRKIWVGWKAEVWRWPPFAAFMRIGLPIGFQTGLEVWAFLGAAFVIGRFGTVPIAANQIVITMASCSFMVPLGIGAAAATRVGNAIGAEKLSDARYSALVAMVIGGGVMTLSAAAFTLFPALLARAFTPDADVIATAVTFLPLAAFFQLFDGTQAVGCGVLRGAADTRAAAVINFIGYWLIGLPLGALLAFRFHLGPRGLWMGLTAGLCIVAVLLVGRVLHRFRVA